MCLSTIFIFIILSEVTFTSRIISSLENMSLVSKVKMKTRFIAIKYINNKMVSLTIYIYSNINNIKYNYY